MAGEGKMGGDKVSPAHWFRNIGSGVLRCSCGFLPTYNYTPDAQAREIREHLAEGR